MVFKLNESKIDFLANAGFTGRGSVTFKLPDMPGNVTVSMETVHHIFKLVSKRVKEIIADKSICKTYGFTQAKLTQLLVSPGLAFMAYVGPDASLEDVIAVLTGSVFIDAETELNNIAATVERLPVIKESKPISKPVKESNAGNLYAITNTADADPMSEDFWGWDTEYDVGYELTTLSNLIPDADIFDTLEAAEDRADDVLSSVFDDEVFIVSFEAYYPYSPTGFVKRITR